MLVGPLMSLQPPSHLEPDASRENVRLLPVRAEGEWCESVFRRSLSGTVHKDGFRPASDFSFTEAVCQCDSAGVEAVALPESVFCRHREVSGTPKRKTTQTENEQNDSPFRKSRDVVRGRFSKIKPSCIRIEPKAGYFTRLKI